MKKFLFFLLFPSYLFAQKFSEAEISKWQSQAKNVTIIRDFWGVPHIYGKTDADCVFGVAYAQAEDNMQQVEDNFIRSVGKGAEIHGQQAWINDQLVHAFEFVKLSKQEYTGASSHMRSLYDAYAAGLNYFLSKNPAYKPILLSRFEPWHPLAMIRYFYYVHDVIPMVGISNSDLQQQFKIDIDTHSTGSNAWAIGPKKTGGKSSMLYFSPHRSLFGNGTFNEVHVESEQGWSFSGATKFGFPIPYMGHNGNIAFAYTVNRPDLGDKYIEHFDHPTDSLLYKYAAGYRKAERWYETITLKTKTGIVKKVVSFLKTHHGPVIKRENGKPIAVRLTNIERTGWFDQWYAMTRARDLDAFKKAGARLPFPYFNTVFADKDGNIFFKYSVASAKRNTKFDWRKPVDGSDAQTEWMGYHSYDELPEILNPASGFIQSCNSDISFTAGANSIDKSNYPAYMIGQEVNNPRSVRSQKILSENEKIDFDKWSKLTVDTRVQLADDSLQAIIDAYQTLAADSQEAISLAPLIKELKGWDYRADTGSIGMTLFRETIQAHRTLNMPFIPALQKAKEKLEQLWGTWQVPWGNINRIQKRDWQQTQAFSDNDRSYPVGGSFQNYGTIVSIIPGRQTESAAQRRLYETFGASFTNIIELGKKVRSKSITCFGQQETGPHSEDQSPLFSKGLFKDAWFYKSDVLKNAERSYHPGE